MSDIVGGLSEAGIEAKASGALITLMKARFRYK